MKTELEKAVEERDAAVAAQKRLFDDNCRLFVTSLHDHAEATRLANRNKELEQRIQELEGSLNATR